MKHIGYKARAGGTRSYGNARMVVMLALLGGSLLLGVRPAHAADFGVTNTGDGGAGSLRQAILDANARGGADTISFAIPREGVKTISPDFSPDGQKVAFSSGWGSHNILTANADGSGGLTVVTDEGAGSATDPEYSPDGQKIAFESDWLNQLDVYVANADGGGVPADITADGYSLEPDWGGVPDAAADTTRPSIVPVGPTSWTTDATPLIRATVRDTPVNPFGSGIRLFVDGKRVTGLSYDRELGLRR